MCENCGCDPRTTKRVEIEQNILESNDLSAAENRAYCLKRGWLMLNLVSSPGAGKTTIIEQTIARMKSHTPFFVIEGDQQTDNDARRIAATGVDAVQINTENGCHLNASMIHSHLEQCNLPSGGIIIVENVGNLVCPALFDLGEKLRIVILSITEGDDKPLKYPYIFNSSAVCLINKTDLAPYVPAQIETIKNNLLHINPQIKIFELSASRGDGIQEWCDYLSQQVTRIEP